MLAAFDLWRCILSIPGIIAALSLHEYVKALVSFRQGDPLPKLRGRLRLNPFKQLDPVGVIIMLATGYGWGKPVETSSFRYRDAKAGTLITYVCPSLVNIVAACVISGLMIVYKIYVLKSDVSAYGGAWWLTFGVYRVFYYAARANLAAAFFNIIPIPPLNGAKILEVFLSPNNAVKFRTIEKMLQLLLLFLLAAGAVGRVFDPLIGTMLKFVYMKGV